MDKQFSRKIVFFNFFYSLMILFYHANANVHFPNIIIENNLLDKVSYGINYILTESSGTYFFMLMSAFLLYRDLTPENTLQKVKRRVKTLIIPWLLWNFIGLLSYHEFEKGLWYLLCNYFTSRFCEQLWFVQALIILLLFIPIIRRLFRIPMIREIALIGVFVLGYLRFPFLQNTEWYPTARLQMEIMRVLNHLPVYCLGAYLGLNYSDWIIEEKYNIKYKKIAVTAALGIILVSYFAINPVLTYFGFILRAAAIWVLCPKRIFVFPIKWWMQIAFYTYAVHNFFLHWEVKIVKLFGMFAEQFVSSTISIEFAVLWRVGLGLLTFLFVALSAWILVHVTPKLFELLSGGRVPKEV